MSTTTTYYEFIKPEGTDLVNPLVDTNPNWDALDADLHEFNERSIANCTEIVTLGVHAISRLDTTSKFLKWIATANFTAGETFTVDGLVVAASTPAGATLATGAYVTGSVVLACLNADNTAMTIYVSGTTVASDAERLGGELPAYYAKQSDMTTAENNITNLSNKMGNTSIVGIGDGTATGAISALNADLTDNAESFKFGYQNSQYGYYDSSSVFHPFKSGLEETTLWTNSSPTSTFSGQTITLSDNLTNYDYIRVYYRYSTADNTEVSVMMSVSDFQISASTGKPNMALGVRTSSPTKRGVSYASDTSVGFASAINDLGNLANSNAIPTKVTGVN